MVNKKSQLHLNYNELFVCNIAATQELDKKVIALENENSELKTKVASLESELAHTVTLEFNFDIYYLIINLSNKYICHLKPSFKDGRLGIGLDVSVNSGAPKYPLLI